MQTAIDETVKVVIKELSTIVVPRAFSHTSHYLGGKALETSWIKELYLVKCNSPTQTNQVK